MFRVNTELNSQHRYLIIGCGRPCPHLYHTSESFYTVDRLLIDYKRDPLEEFGININTSSITKYTPHLQADIYNPQTLGYLSQQKYKMICFEAIPQVFMEQSKEGIQSLMNTMYSLLDDDGILVIANCDPNNLNIASEEPFFNPRELHYSSFAGFLGIYQAEEKKIKGNLQWIDNTHLQLIIVPKTPHFSFVNNNTVSDYLIAFCKNGFGAQTARGYVNGKLQVMANMINMTQTIVNPENKTIVENFIQNINQVLRDQAIEHVKRLDSRKKRKNQSTTNNETSDVSKKAKTSVSSSSSPLVTFSESKSTMYSKFLWHMLLFSTVADTQPRNECRESIMEKYGFKKK